MKIKYIDDIWLKQKVTQILSRYLPLDRYKVFFFGSRVKGTSFERSDIDLGIYGPKPIDSAVKLEIQEELENLPTLYTIDLVDFRKAGKTFKKHALKHVEYLT